jgi:hypothetical protein
MSVQGRIILFVYDGREILSDIIVHTLSKDVKHKVGGGNDVGKRKIEKTAPKIF